MRIYLISKYINKGSHGTFYTTGLWENKEEAEAECNRLNSKNADPDVFFTCGAWEVHRKGGN